MGVHGEDAKPKKNVQNTKKNKFGIKKLAKGLLKKTHRHRADDNEALIESEATGNQTGGRSIEVFPGEEVSLDCSCSLSHDRGHDVDRGHCDVCGGIYGRRGKRQRHVRFSPDVTEDSQKIDPQEGISDGKKRKKHKKLKKARKVTWKAMKKGWKYMKVGLQMFVAGPGVASGTVQMTNLVNNPIVSMGKKSNPYT